MLCHGVALWTRARTYHVLGTCEMSRAAQQCPALTAASRLPSQAVKKRRFRPSLNEANLAAAGLGAEAGAGGFEYDIDELLMHREKAGIYEVLVAWAGYEDQT